MSASYALPARLEGSALSTVRDEVLALRGQDLLLAGQPVERLNGLGLQLLMAAFVTWRRDGFQLRISDPSDAIRSAFQRLNITPDGTEETIS